MEIMEKKNKSNQVKSKQRVSDHGEVFTSEREVNSMLDLVKQETERIDSRFLEPACGTGNFLVEILTRKLKIVRHIYKRSQLDFERNALLAVSSIYGIDLLEDNVEECKKRLFKIFDDQYKSLYKNRTKGECRDSIKYILNRNILRGNALTLKLEGSDEPIVFSEWAFVTGSKVKRRDFMFKDFTSEKPKDLFSDELISDIGAKAYIPTPVAEFPLKHFLKLSDNV